MNSSTLIYSALETTKRLIFHEVSFNIKYLLIIFVQSTTGHPGEEDQKGRHGAAHGVAKREESPTVPTIMLFLNLPTTTKIPLEPRMVIV